MSNIRTVGNVVGMWNKDAAGLVGSSSHSLRLRVLGDVDRSSLRYDIFEETIQQFRAILDRQLRVCSKLVWVRISAENGRMSTRTLLSASKMGLKYTSISPLETFAIL